jgi:hypothetical protein
MKKSEGEKTKYLIMLTSCLDGCCTSQYSKEAFIEFMKIVDFKELKEELIKVFLNWEGDEIKEEESENIFENKYKNKIHIVVNTGVLRQDTSCGCFETIIVKKISELPCTDRVSIN